MIRATESDGEKRSHRGYDEDGASAGARLREADRAKRNKSPPAMTKPADVAGSGLTDVLESPPDYEEVPRTGREINSFEQHRYICTCRVAGVAKPCRKSFYLHTIVPFGFRVDSERNVATIN